MLARLVAFAVVLSLCPSIASAKFFKSRAERDDEYCRSLGAQPGTPLYVQCRLFRDQQRQQESDILMQRGIQMLQPQYPQPLYAPPAPSRCFSRWVYNNLVTNCY